MIKLSAFVVVLITGCIDSTTFEANGSIISKKQWQARPLKYESPPFSSLKISMIVVHESGGPMCDNFYQCSKILQNMQIEQMQNRSDIIHNFLIGGDGNVYEGRGWYKRGAAVRGQNDLCLSIAFIGNFTDYYPTAQAKSAFINLLDFGVKFKTLSNDYKIATHKDFESIGNEFFKHAKKCPGKKLFDFIKSLPRPVKDSIIVHAIID